MAENPTEEPTRVKCREYAGGLSRGLDCSREHGHPGLHRDDYEHVYWKRAPRQR